MDTNLPIVAINYYFGPNELNNRIFSTENDTPVARNLKAFRALMRERGAEVVTLDTVDFRDPRVKYVLYFEYNWRWALSDPFLRKVPRGKRALALLEPANINPSMYYTSLLRDRFDIVFTFDWNLLRKNPSYTRINVPLGAEPSDYRENPFKHRTFSNKRFLVAVSMNRWSYMPQSTYGIRKKAYAYFERAFPNDFDLFGRGWNRPCIFYEKWLGHPTYASWRGEIEDSWDAKVRKIAEYKFALCYENNASEPGYISEKLTDCLCARCVPVYYGSAGTDELVPRDAWIDARTFHSNRELGLFLRDMDASRYNRYIEAIDRFMAGSGIDYFSTAHFNGCIADRLGFPDTRGAARNRAERAQGQGGVLP